MFNQGWHLISGPVQVPDSVGGDTQLTDPYMLLFRMSGRSEDPGPEIVVYIYGEYSDPNSGESPLVVTAMVVYEIREDNDDRDVNDADCEFRTALGHHPDAETAGRFAEGLARHYARLGDALLNWTGESAMQRTGGPVSAKAE
jgi:hypothetical protein